MQVNGSGHGHGETASRPAELLRCATAGSVDDGKSTLIGRLLYETKSVYEDQLAEVERASRQRGSEAPDLALLTDGLRAEREQGITIDVAYRYFATPRRSFILADTPGHVQYTRNMITGTSTADVSLVLLDAVRGVTEQTRRHLFIAALMRVPHVVVCLNKMDLVGYDSAVFERLAGEVRAYAARLGLPDLSVIPIAALHGDNVVTRSIAMAWYDGPALLEYLETLPLRTSHDLADGRFPVQWVIRPPGANGGRRYAGQVAGGILRPGDLVAALPSGLTARIAAIETFDGLLAEAAAPRSVTVVLTDELDISRGDLLCPVDRQPAITREIEADLCWLMPTPLRLEQRYTLKHTTRSVKAVVTTLRHRVDITSLTEDTTATTLTMNEVGRAILRTTAPLCCDTYAKNRVTGSFVLIDEGTHATVAAGLIR